VYILGDVCYIFTRADLLVEQYNDEVLFATKCIHIQKYAIEQYY